MTAFLMAWNFLTIIPLGNNFTFEMDKFSRSMMFYPLVGAILGVILTLTYLLLHPFIPSTHLHVILFTLLVVMSGAIHLDGFSDSVDGLFVEKSRVLEVMKDPHVGAMGMIFTFTFLLFKLSSFILLEQMSYLIIILALSRYNAVFAIYFFEYVSSGFSKGAKEHFQTKDFLLSSLFIGLLVLYFEHGIYLLLSSLATLYLIKLLFYKKIDGFSGDVYGFSIEVSELMMLNTLILLC